jgi:hypothetical protein
MLELHSSDGRRWTERDRSAPPIRRFRASHAPPGECIALRAHVTILQMADIYSAGNHVDCSMVALTSDLAAYAVGTHYGNNR